MCLSKIMARLTPTDEVRPAWKIVELNGDGAWCQRYYTLGGAWIPCTSTDQIPTDIWLEATQATERTAKDLEEYMTGFHCFDTKADAERYRKMLEMKDETAIVQVFARKVRLVGTESWASGRAYARVIVADEIYYPSNQEQPTWA